MYKDGCYLEGHVLAKPNIGPCLPRQQKFVIAGSFRLPSRVLIIELSKISKQVHVPNCVFEFFKSAFGINVRSQTIGVV